MSYSASGVPYAGFFGIAGPSMTDEEKRLFSQKKPIGFILFTRNCESPDQVKALVAQLKGCTWGEDTLVLIDQEGGRVSRLKPPHWPTFPAAASFDTLSDATVPSDIQAIYSNARLIARELHRLGINVNCAPLADVPVKDAHDIIGDRAFSAIPELVAQRARVMAQGLMDGGVLPVLKHIPGHGRARCDSHEALPVVHASFEALMQTDFVPFRSLHNLPLGMTAHIVFTALDAALPATLSPRVMQVVREVIGFDGLLMSDDISMKALEGEIGAIARASIAAGCDAALHCNGRIEEMQAIMEQLPRLSGEGYRRLQAATSAFRPPAASFDYAQAEAWLQRMQEAV